MPNALGKTTFRWPSLAMLLGLLAVFLMPVGALGNRLSIWSFQIGLALIAAAFLVAALSVLVAIGVQLKRWRAGEGTWSALVLPALPAVLVLLFLMPFILLQQRLPAIHNISTDTNNPPNFAVLVSIREKSGSNPLQYRHSDQALNLAEIQNQAYPDITPILSSLSEAAAFSKALELAAEHFNWDIASANQQAGLIEATDTTFWFGFQDDIAIRIRPDSSGSRIDLRSVSRVGLADFGVNADRIRAFTLAWQEG